ncbi:MAG TPA: FtsX-like permease family protein [Gaiellaceae bacterium]|nr:FtsX-like permease family protein [Gaiellaceae bacterium]
MSKLFGIPVGTLALVLVALLVLSLAAVTVAAVRNRVFVRLGLRSAQRRRGRSALIVAGLMLGTVIIGAALATGDTMSQTIRSTALGALGSADEVVGAKGIGSMFSTGTGGTGMPYFPQSDTQKIVRAGGDRVTFVYPAVVDSVAVADIRSRQTEPRVTLYASTAAGLPTGALRPGEVVLNPKAADKLDAKAGDALRVLAGPNSITVRVKEVRRYTGGAAPAGGLLISLPTAQRLFEKPGMVDSFLVGNRDGVAGTSSVIAALKPTLGPLGLEADNSRQDFIKLADQQGAAFMSLFTTFGSFSIMAGVLLIFLIFVMLAAERRSELGIARAVGTRRSHLVWMYTFEGLGYDLVAAAVGALIGIGVAYLMVLALSGLFAESDISVGFTVEAASIALAYSIGVLLTLLVVAYSARRVSRMNIVSAIRGLPEPAARKTRRRRWLWPAVGILFGLLFVWAGVQAEDAVSLGVGFSVLVLSAVPLLSLAGLPDRPVRTAAGLALVCWFTLPIPRLLLGQLKTNFSLFVFGGLMIVIGATWVIAYNADLLLGGLSATLGRIRPLAPVLRMAVAYPLRSLFRTGVTLAMFTLVVFTLVVGSTITGSMVHAFNDVGSYGGGFDVRADVSPSTPIGNVHQALRHARGLDPADFRAVAAMSSLPVKAQQLGQGVKPEDFVVHGVDNAFLRNTTYGIAAHAPHYASAAAVWRAVRTHPGLAVIDSMSVPHKINYNFGAAQAFRLRGFYLEDKTFAPMRVRVRDRQTGHARLLTVIGVLSETAPQTMVGLYTAQSALTPTFGGRVRPTTYLLALRRGADPVATAKRLEAAFLANGMQADAMSKLLHDAVSSSLTFDRLIEAFMALGLLVGVTALGVISARAVVERRQQIGVLRAIGFRRRMVQLSFLLESSFIALTAIVVGTGLGLAVAFNVVDEYARQPSMENLGLDVPWPTLVVIFLAVYAVAMLTTLAPARRAARVFPAEALRYQ